MVGAAEINGTAEYGQLTVTESLETLLETPWTRSIRNDLTS